MTRNPRASQRPRALRPVTAPMTAIDQERSAPNPPGATGRSWQRPRPLRRPAPPDETPVEPDDPED
jgi:hypothetical protein